MTESARTVLAEAGPPGRLSNAVCSLAFDPDGATLAVGLRDPNTIVLLDPTTLAVRGRLAGHTAQVSRLVFLPGGKTLASSGFDGTIRLWDVATGRRRLLIEGLRVCSKRVLIGVT